MSLLPTITRPSPRDWIFSGRTFLAAMLALFIALQMDLPRPYWSMVTVYIVSQPLAGMARSKGIYRILGTVCGAVFAVAAVPTLVNAPELLTLAIASWIGICLYFSLMDGTPRAYAFILAGYTAAIIGFPSVDAPQGMFDTAVARSEEIILGILCVIAVGYLPFSQRVGPLLQQRLDRWMADARGWARAVLSDDYAGWSASSDVQRLIADAVDIDTLQIHARYDTPELRRAETAIFQLQGRMQQFFSVLLSLDDTLGEIRADAPESLPRLMPLVQETGAWIAASTSDDATGVQGRALRQRLWHDMTTASSGMPTEEAVLARSLLSQLRLLIKLWDGCLDLQGMIRRGEPAKQRYRRPARHRDARLAALSAIACFSAIVVSAAFWILSAWPEGNTACMEVAIICCFFAALDNPAAAAIGWLHTSIIGTAIAAVYMFALLPQADGFVQLAASLALLMLPLAAFMAVPSQNSFFLPLLINSLTLVTIQGRFTVDIEVFINTAVALCLGTGIAVVTFRLAGNGGAAAVVQRLVRAGRDDLLLVARGRSDNADAFIGRMTDRISRLLARSPLLGNDAGPAIRRLLRQMQIGLHMMQLQKLRRHELPPLVALKIQRLMETLDGYFASDRLGVDEGLAVLDAATLQIRGSSTEGAALHKAEVDALVALSRMKSNLHLVSRSVIPDKTGATA